MNQVYLLQYVSRRLHTGVRLFDAEGKIKEFMYPRSEYREIFPHGDLSEVMTLMDDEGTFINEMPLLFSIGKDADIVCAVVPMEDQYALIGPCVILEPIRLRRCLEKNSLMKEDNDVHDPEDGAHGYRSELSASAYRTKASGYACPLESLTSVILLMVNLYRDHTEELTEEQLLAYSCRQDIRIDNVPEESERLIFENRENSRHHNPYDQEVREFTSIEKGNVDQLSQSLREDYSGKIGVLAKSPLRNAKNRGIVVITLACRSAIRGGMSSEESFSISDSYIQRLEECTDLPSVFRLFHSAEYEYARRVHQIIERKKGITVTDSNPHINACKDYIFSHLHDRITVQDIADALRLNANYLSGLFRNIEHCTISEFIRREKLNLVKNLLIYSPYSCSEIASYLNFSSQSHLGHCFKEETGMTMLAFRNRYGKSASWDRQG